MTCEDDNGSARESVVERGARQIAVFLASGPIRTLARLLPPDVKRAIATVLLTAANVLRT